MRQTCRMILLKGVRYQNHWIKTVRRVQGIYDLKVSSHSLLTTREKGCLQCSILARKKKSFKLILIMRGKNQTNPDCGTFYTTTSLDSKHVNVMKKKKRKENYFRLKKMKRMLNKSNHQRNANQNHNEILPLICQNAAAAAKSLQSCPTLCDPTDGSPPGSPIPGILQARTLEWVAISFSSE